MSRIQPLHVRLDFRLSEDFGEKGEKGNVKMKGKGLW